MAVAVCLLSSDVDRLCFRKAAGPALNPLQTLTSTTTVTSPTNWRCVCSIYTQDDIRPQVSSVGSVNQHISM